MWRAVAIASLAALAANVAPAIAGSVSPLEKVITMLTDLRQQLKLEAEEEVATYNKFACFCKDTTAELTSSISSGETNQNTLQADLAAALIARDGQDSGVAEKLQAIEADRKAIQDLTAARHEALLQYEGSEVDLTAALQGLEAAIRSLQAAKTATSFAAVMESVQRAIVVAEALPSKRPLKGANSVAVLASLGRQQAEAAGKAGQPYAFHADDIISTLEQLTTQFKAKKQELDQQEVASRQEFDSQVQTKEAAIKDAEDALKMHQKEKADLVERISQLSTDLTTTSSQLLEDQKVLTELSDKCHNKAVLWDARSQARADELSALTKALEVMQGLAAAAPTAPPSLFQFRAVKVGGPMLQDRMASAAQPYALMQVVKRHVASSDSSPAPPAFGRRARVVSLLRLKAAQVHSVALLQVSRRAAEDPLAKVKSMIQGLVEKLLKEAADEASHKGWCDKEVELAEIRRDSSAANIKDLNSKLEIGEARREELGLLINKLDAELLEVNATLNESTVVREQEKTQNAAAVKAATDGSAAVAEAIDVLTKYYKTAAKNAAASLLQGAGEAHRGPMDDAPDAGFDSAYLGAQGGKEGIIGMLEVIKSDFDATIKQTQEAETKAQKDYVQLQTTLGAAQAEKLVAKGEREKALQEAEADNDEQHKGLSDNQALLDKALGELLALKPACFGGGDSPEERKQKRDAEIEALNQGLCILEHHGVAGGDMC